MWSVRVAADLLRSVPERARCSPRHTSTVPSVCVRDISLVYPHSVWNPRRLGSEAFNLNQCVASGYAVLRSYFIVSITPPPPGRVISPTRRTQTARNTHKKETSLPPPTRRDSNSQSQEASGPQTYALDRAATCIDESHVTRAKLQECLKTSVVT